MLRERFVWLRPLVVTISLFAGAWGVAEVAGLTWSDIGKGFVSAWSGFISVRPFWTALVIVSICTTYLVLRKHTNPLVFKHAEYELVFDKKDGSDARLLLTQEIVAKGSELNAVRSLFASAGKGCVPKETVLLSADSEYEHSTDQLRFDWEEIPNGWIVVHRLKKPLQPSWPFRPNILTRTGSVRFIDGYLLEEDYIQCAGFYDTKRLVVKVSFDEARVPTNGNVWAEKICGWAVIEESLPPPARANGKVTYTYKPRLEKNITDVRYRIAWRFTSGQ